MYRRIYYVAQKLAGPREDSCAANQALIATRSQRVRLLRYLRRRIATRLAKNEKNRKAKLAQFAKEHGFRLIYKLGLCAMFAEEASDGEVRTREKQRADRPPQRAFRDRINLMRLFSAGRLVLDERLRTPKPKI